jgi:hypothetical protein
MDADIVTDGVAAILEAPSSLLAYLLKDRLRARRLR